MGLIARQSFKASISNYIGFVLGFISLLLLFPLFFTPEQLGAYRLFIELGGMLSAFALLGTNSSINRYFPYFKTEDQKHHGFFFWVFLLPLIGFAILLLLFFVFGDAFFVFINENALRYRNMFPMFVVLIFANIFIVVSEVSYANHGRIALTNFSKEVILRILIIISGCLYYYKFVDFYTCIWFVVIAYVLTFLLNIFFLAKLTKVNLKPDFIFLIENKKLTKEIILFTLVLLFSAFSTLIIPKIDFILVSKLDKDLSNVAIYSIGFTLATFIEIPKRTILQISNPTISAYLKDNNIREVEVFHKKNGSNQFIISTFLFLLIWMNLDNLFKIMPDGNFYSQGKWVVLIIGLSKVIESIFSSQGAIISNSSLYKWTPLIVLFNGVCAVIFNYYFISKFGYIGGAISNFSAMLVLTLFCYILIYKKINITPFEKSQLYVLLSFILVFSFTFIGNWFENPFVDATIRSIVFSYFYLFFIYKCKASKDFTDLVFGKFPVLKYLFPKQ